MAKVDFYFDFISPYSYLATFRLPELVERHGVELDYHAIDLEAAKLAAGNTRAPNHALPKKLRYLCADLRRCAEIYGVPLKFPEGPSAFDVSATARLNRGFLWAKRHKKEKPYLTNGFAAVWVRGDKLDDEALRKIAAASGLEPEGFLRALASDELAKEFGRENLAAQERGVFGVPTFIVDDQLFWGNDRIEFLEEYLRDPAKAVRL
jgi:2-hydroxychromene-2-carboxylate isomerase